MNHFLVLSLCPKTAFNLLIDYLLISISSWCKNINFYREVNYYAVSLWA